MIMQWNPMMKFHSKFIMWNPMMKFHSKFIMVNKLFIFFVALLSLQFLFLLLPHHMFNLFRLHLFHLSLILSHHTVFWSTLTLLHNPYQHLVRLKLVTSTPLLLKRLFLANHSLLMSPPLLLFSRFQWTSHISTHQKTFLASITTIVLLVLLLTRWPKSQSGLTDHQLRSKSSSFSLGRVNGVTCGVQLLKGLLSIFPR
ncbi:hypothetical protein CVT25_007500 [Psilocybe cyanescens]|uniref:Uncharacterized protein n=1 Tax=Psilocybe cyanescens TaxID=93625 RepID=A0A409X6S0_PSICY|nr:hypothetical protein CVT25_007500 [Psilocybe cyanescens]